MRQAETVFREESLRYTLIDRVFPRQRHVPVGIAVEKSECLDDDGHRCEEPRAGFVQQFPAFSRPHMQGISAVDATSFAITKRRRIRIAYAFDHHFVVVGFRLVT